MRRAWPSKIDMLLLLNIGSCILNWRTDPYAGYCGRVVWKVSTVYHGLKEWEGEECHHHRLTRRPEEFSTLRSSLVLFRVDAIVKRGKNEKKQGAASKNSIPPRYWHYYTACRADSKGRDWLFYCTFNWDCQSACSFPGPEKRHYDYHY